MKTIIKVRCKIKIVFFNRTIDTTVKNAMVIYNKLTMKKLTGHLQSLKDDGEISDFKFYNEVK